MNRTGAKKYSLGLIVFGGLVLLVAIVRILLDSTDIGSTPGWAIGEPGSLDRALATTPTGSMLPEFTATSETRTTALAIEGPTPTAPAGTPIPASSPGSAYKEGETFLAEPSASRTLTPDQPGVPVRILISSIGLDAPVVPAKSRKILLENKLLEQWVPPEQFAGGWIVSSALLGEKGNTVISGHHNDFGEVFGRLIDVNVGDTILVFTSSEVHRYKVTNKMLLQELEVPIEQRIENARWIGRSTDERLTLVTCWPKTGNSHRLILVAKPD